MSAFDPKQTSTPNLPCFNSDVIGCRHRIKGPHETARFPIALGRRAWPLPKNANLLDGRREYARKRRNGKTYRNSRCPSGGPA